MNKTRKLQLAEYIISHSSRLSASGVMKLSDSKNLGVQVKTINSNGDFVIKFSSNDLWMDPVEWLHNYKTSCKQRYEEAKEVYESLFPPENTNKPISEVIVPLSSTYFQRLMSMLNMEPVDGSNGMRYRYPITDAQFNSVDDEVSRRWKTTKGISKRILHLGLLLDRVVEFKPPFDQKVIS